MTPQQRARAEIEMAGMVWSRAARRRLARAGGGPGRRKARRWPLRRELAYRGFTRPHVDALALLAVPGLAPADVDISSPRPGCVVVTLRGPMATAEAVANVRAALAGHVPVGVDLGVMSKRRSS